MGAAVPVRWGWPLLAALLYVSVCASLLAYRAWGLAVAQGGPALAAFFANLTPLFAALLSAAVLGETPRPFHAGAFVLIVAGIAVSSSGAAKETAQKTAQTSTVKTTEKTAPKK